MLKTQQVFESATKKNLSALSVGFFVSDIISGKVLGLFGSLHLALGPNQYMVVFCTSLCW